jgi:hypothetical protein
LARAHSGHSWPLRDRLGPDFTLLVTAHTPDATLLLDSARAIGVPLQELALVDPAWRSRLGGALLLVRPDHHIAWRGDRLPMPASSLLNVVCGAVGPVT